MNVIGSAVLESGLTYTIGTTTFRRGVWTEIIDPGIWRRVSTNSNFRCVQRVHKVEGYTPPDVPPTPMPTPPVARKEYLVPPKAPAAMKPPPEPADVEDEAEQPALLKPRKPKVDEDRPRKSKDGKKSKKRKEQ